MRYDEACEESVISTHNLYYHLLSCLSWSLFAPIFIINKLSSLALFKPPRILPTINGAVPSDLRYSTKSLRNDGTQWFFAVAAFPIPVRSKEFFLEFRRDLFGQSLYQKSEGTLLVIEPYCRPAKGRYSTAVFPIPTPDKE